MVTRSKERVHGLAGSVAVLASALCFYLSTATIRWAQLRGITPDPAFYVLVRFLLGFVVITGILTHQKRPPRPISYHLLVGRTVANCIAVYCFYRAVQTTSVAHANILNMTYPLFVAVMTWAFLPNQREWRTSLALMAAFAGIVLILHPGKMAIDIQHFWGLASGISAALAIIYLNLSRRTHDSETILFYMFGLGSLLIFAGFHDRMVIREGADIIYLALCGGFGIAGQYLITLGFRYVTAVEGSILSSTRILIAAFAGPFVAMDPALAVQGWAGALLIFAANVYLAFRKAGS